MASVPAPMRLVSSSARRRASATYPSSSAWSLGKRLPLRSPHTRTSRSTASGASDLAATTAPASSISGLLMLSPDSRKAWAMRFSCLAIAAASRGVARPGRGA